MPAALRVCLPLLLLACDFTCDTCCGTCPWSSSWGNQEAFCHSYVYREEVSRACTAPQQSSSCRPAAAPARPLPTAPTAPRWKPLTPMGSAPLVYLLMSLRR